MSLTTNILKEVAQEGMEYLGKFYSFYRGVVEDNKDPAGLCRIKAIVPGIIDESIDYWIMPINQYAGKGYGTVLIPPEGSAVIILFEMGDPSQPVYLQGWQGTGERNPEDCQPHITSHTTPGGASVSIDDKNYELVVTSHTGTKIHMNGEGVSVELASEREKIYLGSKDKADEPSVLGDTLQAMMEKIMDSQEVINNQIKELGDKILGTLRDIGTASPATVSGSTVVARATTLAVQIEVIKSKVTSNNESIKTQYKRLKEFKSKTVKLNK